MFNILKTREILNFDSFLIFKYIEIDLFLLHIRNYSHQIYDNHLIILSITSIIDIKIFKDLSIPYEDYWLNGLHLLSPCLLMPKKISRCPVCNNPVRFLGSSAKKNTKCIVCHQIISSYES